MSNSIRHQERRRKRARGKAKEHPAQGLKVNTIKEAIEGKR